MKTCAFSQIEIHLFEGDMLYSTTDGFADQFGGPKGKKFMYKPLKKLLIDINKISAAVHEAFQIWKGTSEQVDDVCMIGIRF